MHQNAFGGQLVSDSLDESEQICQQRVELSRVGGVNAPVGSRRELVANGVHTAESPTRLNSTAASRRRRRCVLGTRHYLTVSSTGHLETKNKHVKFLTFCN